MASPNYGKHMTAEEVIDFFAPHESTVTTVIDWIVGSGIARERVSQSVNKQVSHFSKECSRICSLPPYFNSGSNSMPPPRRLGTYLSRTFTYGNMLMEALTYLPKNIMFPPTFGIISTISLLGLGFGRELKKEEWLLQQWPRSETSLGMLKPPSKSRMLDL